MYLRKTNHPDRSVSTRRLGRVPDMEATDTNNPNLNYGLVVDCGSSGSRVFVYTWPRHNGNPHELLDIKQMRDKHRKPVVMKIKPGQCGNELWSLHTKNDIFVWILFKKMYSSSFPIKMLATDAKMHKIEPDPNFFTFIYIYIYAFSRCFYPKRLTGYIFFISMCVPWESNPQPLCC